MSDLYGILGVQKGASAEEIKRAYRKEALTHHPDRGGSKERFQALGEAYDILSNDDKRDQYDVTGQIPRGSDEGGGGPDLGAMFSSMFGSGFPGGPGFPGGGGMPFFGMNFGPSAVKPARGPNKIHEIGVSLADLYKGKKFTVTMKRDVLCGGCKGSGGARIDVCGACGGKGFQLRGQQMGPIMAMTHAACASCNQTGKRVKEQCGACKGRQTQDSESVLEVVIAPGMREGDRITFPGKCSESPQFDSPGDVILVLRAVNTDSDVWIRNGDTLTVSVTLSLAESLLGWERQLEGHPSGRSLHIVWKDGVLREGETLRIEGWGMPCTGSEALGDMRLVCHVAEQSAWSDEQRRALLSVWPDWKEPVVKEDTVVASRSA